MKEKKWSNSKKDNLFTAFVTFNNITRLWHQDH